MIFNTYINYGGRFSRLCYLVPSIVHTLFLYISYSLFFNMNLFNIYILYIGILFLNFEWILVITYEYIYLSNFNILNNLMSNIAYLILLEILLFLGFYWLYIHNIIHYPTATTFNFYLHFNLLDSLNTITNSDICLHVILNNLCLLLYITLLLQLLHKYLLTPNPSFFSFDFNLSFSLFLFDYHNSYLLGVGILFISLWFLSQSGLYILYYQDIRSLLFLRAHNPSLAISFLFTIIVSISFFVFIPILLTQFNHTYQFIYRYFHSYTI
jgi:hypothetical protein